MDCAVFHNRVGRRFSQKVTVMKEADEEDRLLRRYLLGELDEPEQERIEERFIADGGFRERALIAEEELVEDYLARRLSEADGELFVGRFLSTPEQRQKLQIAASLDRYLTAEKPHPPMGPGGEARPPGVTDQGLRQSPFWRKPTALAPAFLVLLAAVLVLVWLSTGRQRRNELAEVRRVLERINAQPVSDRAGGEFLNPIAVRGGAREANVLPAPAEGTVVTVWLLLVKDEYRRYQVVFQKDGQAERFTVDGLGAEITPRGRAVPVRLPATLLGPGVYTLKLNGVADGGVSEEINGYNFQVSP